jgi:hypothetical protein
VVVGSTSELRVAELDDPLEADAARIDLGRARAALQDAVVLAAASRTQLLDLEVQLEHARRRAEADALLAAERERLARQRLENQEAVLRLRRQLEWERAALRRELESWGVA